MQKKHLFYLGTMALALLIAGSVFAAGPGNGGFAPGNRPMGAPGQRNGQGSMISGTVSAISGTTITLSGKQGFNPGAAAVSYTIDASNATFNKFSQGADGRPTSTAISLSDIQVGNTITVRGTVSGTAVTAKVISTGQIGRGMTGNGPVAYGRRGGQYSSSTPSNAALGNRILGTITAINNTSITLVRREMPGSQASSTNYTIDASNAKISSGFGANLKTLAISDLSVGDTIEANGTISGNSITATAISKITKPAAPAGQRLNEQTNHGTNKNATSSKVSRVRNVLSKIFAPFKNLFKRFFR
jgi:Domain of unknown function (DUF5666)